MKVLYTCAWDKDKEKTWSGTTYSLYKALRTKIILKDVDVRLSKSEKLLMKLSRLSSLRLKNGKIKISYYFSSLRPKIYQKKLDKLIKDDNEAIVLQIGEYGVCKNKAYVYQDLSLDSLFYFKKNKNQLFQYSGFENYSDKDLNRRRNEQLKFYENLEGIFTMGKWLSKNLVEYTKIPKEKVHWVGGGINISLNKIKNKNKTNSKVLFVGRDFFRKGGDITYNSFKILKERYMPNAELYIAGPKEWPLKEKIDGVIFLGDISTDKLSNYFNQCDIFCMPSRFEAYGLVFIEALVYGLPCIGRNEFEMKEFIKDGYNGYLINNDDVEILAKKMYDLLNNKEIRKNVIKNRENYIKQYSWDTVADRIINVINTSKN